MALALVCMLVLSGGTVTLASAQDGNGGGYGNGGNGDGYGNGYDGGNGGNGYGNGNGYEPPDYSEPPEYPEQEYPELGDVWDQLQGQTEWLGDWYSQYEQYTDDYSRDWLYEKLEERAQWAVYEQDPSYHLEYQAPIQKMNSVVESLGIWQEFGWYAILDGKEVWAQFPESDIFPNIWKDLWGETTIEIIPLQTYLPSPGESPPFEYPTVGNYSIYNYLDSDGREGYEHAQEDVRLTIMEVQEEFQASFDDYYSDISNMAEAYEIDYNDLEALHLAYIGAEGPQEQEILREAYSAKAIELWNTYWELEKEAMQMGQEVKERLEYIKDVGYDLFMDALLRWDSLDVILGSSADLHVYDSLGRHVGINYETGEVETMIPDAEFMFIENIDNTLLDERVQAIYIRNPSEEAYGVEIIGTEDGSYTLITVGDIENTFVYWWKSKVSTSSEENHSYIISVSPVMLNPPDGLLATDNTPNFDWEPINKLLGKYDVQIDDDAYFSSPTIAVSLKTDNYTPVVGLADGHYYWRVRVVDMAGNPSPWSETQQFTIDTKPPASAVDQVSSFWRKEVPFYVSVTASDGLSGVESVELFYRYSNDNSSWGSWTSFGADNLAPYLWTFDAPEGDGYYQFYSVAFDHAGNAELPDLGAKATKNLLPTDDLYTSQWGTWSHAQEIGVDAYNVSYLKFDLSGLPAGSAIASAKLHLMLKAAEDGGQKAVVKIGNVENDAWSEDSFVWESRPPVGATLDNLTIQSFTGVDCGSPAWHQFEVTEFVADQFQKDAVASFALLSEEDDLIVYFVSKDGTSAYPSEYKPYLEVAYLSPLPDAWSGVDTVTPESVVGQTKSYWQNALMVPFEISAAASDPIPTNEAMPSGVKSVSLYYRYSLDNLTWGEWKLYGVDGGKPWRWEFDAPEGDGYYEFRSAASDAAGNEEAVTQRFIEHFADSLDTGTWSVGNVRVKYDNVRVLDGRLEMSARANKSGEYGALYLVSKERFDISQGLVVDVQMTVPTDNAPADFRSEFYLASAFTTGTNPHDLPDWLRVSASVDRNGVTWMLQRKRLSAGVGLGTLYTSGSTHNLSGTWKIAINGENFSVWLDNQQVENWRPHGLPFTNAYVYLAERTKVAPVYTVSFGHVLVQELADASAGVDTTSPQSSVTPTERYWQNAGMVPLDVTATAGDSAPQSRAVPSGLETVTLWYRYSPDNLDNGKWLRFGINDHEPWGWKFGAQWGEGHYGFISEARDVAGNTSLPSTLLMARLRGDGGIDYVEEEGEYGTYLRPVPHISWIEIEGEGVSGYWENGWPRWIDMNVLGVDFVVKAEVEEMWSEAPLPYDSVYEFEGFSGRLWLPEPVLAGDIEILAVDGIIAGMPDNISGEVRVTVRSVHTLDAEVEIGVDATPPASYVDPIEPYWQVDTPFTVTASMKNAENVNVTYKLEENTRNFFALFEGEVEWTQLAPAPFTALKTGPIIVDGHWRYRSAGIWRVTPDGGRIIGRNFDEGVDDRLWEYDVDRDQWHYIVDTQGLGEWRTITDNNRMFILGVNGHPNPLYIYDFRTHALHKINYSIPEFYQEDGTFRVNYLQGWKEKTGELFVGTFYERYNYWQEANMVYLPWRGEWKYRWGPLPQDADTNVSYFDDWESSLQKIVTVDRIMPKETSGTAKVELYYRYSPDNSTWGDWKMFASDGEAPYEWSFDIPAGHGFYEFYSVAIDVASNIEDAPDEADARCATLIPAMIDIDPDTLNLRNNGGWITAYIELLPGFDVSKIRIDTVAVEGETILQSAVPAVSDPKYGFVKDPEIKDRDGDGLPELMVKFDRAAVQALLEAGKNVEITVIGRWGEAPFRGSDNIRVIDLGWGQGTSNGHGNNQSLSGQSGANQGHGAQDTPPRHGGQSSEQGDQGKGQGPPQTLPGHDDQPQAQTNGAGNQGNQSQRQSDLNRNQGNQSSQNGQEQQGNSSGNQGGQGQGKVNGKNK
ncbi:MAG: DNRLRE domain-containing protein [Candidatus Hadarchaeota archaeon]